MASTNKRKKQFKQQRGKTLEVTPEGVFLVINKSKRGGGGGNPGKGKGNGKPGKGNGKGNGKPGNQKDVERYPVGLVIIDAEAFDIDPKNSSVRKKIILDEAQYWLEFYDEKLVELNNLPGNKKAGKRARFQRE